ncbi:PREDICTED: probable 28S ribosomal protein S6, mitochondrial [Dufourea novaeangliae]|uniref:Small ribosomal subunit protein bS6m n=1 Tax=Dufourea novaeangliae TaxID=178035 RepID=A0A154PG66_DUFNO|nr:PREDICTED: probable 28S ribosomal protein S6, mitochondrial [Dufourea novaeangliae]KZC10822.1 putative 28S ribosomal protein S6, mitochondrial [Dufourea novaeangliae]
MPTYEMPILLRIMNKVDYSRVLRRMADTIFETGGIIRKIENWGEKQLPCKASSHGKVHREAGYFFFCFDVPPTSLMKLSDEFNRDIDVIRTRIYKQNPIESNEECTLEQELLPPAYRPSILKLLEEGRRKKKHEFKYNSGLDYYPFQ